MAAVVELEEVAMGWALGHVELPRALKLQQAPKPRPRTSRSRAQGQPPSPRALGSRRRAASERAAAARDEQREMRALHFETQRG